VFDALELESSCGVTRPIPTGSIPPPSDPLPSGPAVFFVDPSGDDSHAGTESAPFATVDRAVAATRSASTTPKAVVLRKGTHFLGTESVKLTAADSGLLITNYPGEEAWVSGGVPLKTSWEKYNTTNGTNVWVTHIADAATVLAVGNGTFDGLMTLETHERLIRARWVCNL
jgi:hypothetical protein